MESIQRELWFGKIRYLLDLDSITVESETFHKVDYSWTNITFGLTEPVYVFQQDPFMMRKMSGKSTIGIGNPLRILISVSQIPNTTRVEQYRFGAQSSDDRTSARTVARFFSGNS